MRTCRRQLLDDFLTNVAPYFTGVVLDIGGKKSDQRGLFRAPIAKVEKWLYLNIDLGTSPDILASADQIPLDRESVDVFLLCEVLEHLAEPEKCLTEAARILKSGGYGIITMPFLYPIHADPWDYQRWTDVRIKNELLNAGFEIIEIRNMGGVFAVIADIAHVAFSKLSPFKKKIIFLILRIIKIVFGSTMRLEHPKITTGFSAIVRKPSHSE